MQALGEQYEPDDAFRRRARKHQSWYRAEVLDLPCDYYGNMLTEEDAKKGLNFYSDHDYKVFEAVTTDPRYREYKKQLYANMLRSEHIPFNVFVPFRTEEELFCCTVASVTELHPAKVLAILIEHAPSPAAKYLNDSTSFDVFCDCEDPSGNRFFIAIEVKYTERGYKIGKKEQGYCECPFSPYNRISVKSGLFLPGVLGTGQLKTDMFRQVWRNHLLAESLLQDRTKHYEYYKSVMLYPSKNKHMSEVATQYRGFLSKEGADSFLGITFEDFFDSIDTHASCSGAKDWVVYLRRRYIPPE